MTKSQMLVNGFGIGSGNWQLIHSTSDSCSTAFLSVLHCDPHSSIRPVVHARPCAGRKLTAEHPDAVYREWPTHYGAA